MQRLTTFVASGFVTCVTALPAFADPIGNFWGGIGGFFHGSPSGAPAPLLAAGIPAFIAVGGGALAMKLFRHRHGSAQ
jgi:hypothetical protein